MNDIRNDNDRNDNNDTNDRRNVDNVKDINNIDDNDRNDNDGNARNEFNSFFLAKEELLAIDLAEGLDDRINLGFYLSICRKYPEELLRKIYSQVKEIPLKKIRKSRGALFNYLLQNYDKKSP
jgi:hypothetical protein